MPEPWMDTQRVRKENSLRALKFQVYSHTCLSRLTGTQTGETTHHEIFIPELHKQTVWWFQPPAYSVRNLYQNQTAVMLKDMTEYFLRKLNISASKLQQLKPQKHTSLVRRAASKGEDDSRALTTTSSDWVELIFHRSYCEGQSSRTSFPEKQNPLPGWW